MSISDTDFDQEGPEPDLPLDDPEEGDTCEDCGESWEDCTCDNDDEGDADPEDDDDADGSD
jgi:hypothetical protein